MTRVTKIRKVRRSPSFQKLPDIHPLIRVVSLLLFIAAISLARPMLLMTGFMLLAGIYLLSGFPAMDRLLIMLKRLRWLMLAIVLVYGWWTPGTALFPVAGALSPTVEGLQLGFIRMLVLVIIVAAVHLLLQRTERTQLLAALMQLFTPLCSLQDRSRIAVRIVLSMEAVGQIQPLLLTALSGSSLANKRLTGLGTIAADVYQTVLDKAACANCEPIHVVEAAQPACWQWLIPLLLAAAIFLLF